MTLTEARRIYRASRDRAAMPGVEFDRRATAMARDLSAASRLSRGRVRPCDWAEAAEILAMPPEPEEKPMPAAALQLPPMTSISPSSPEWEAAWAALAARMLALYGVADRAMEHDGESWQYMCTFYSGGGWWHEFRHRSHPHASGQRKVCHLQASLGFVPEVQ